MHRELELIDGIEGNELLCPVPEELEVNERMLRLAHQQGIKSLSEFAETFGIRSSDVAWYLSPYFFRTYLDLPEYESGHLVAWLRIHQLVGMNIEQTIAALEQDLNTLSYEEAHGLPI